MDYSKLLKTIRERKLLSQTDLAKELGVSYATVNRIENSRHEPTFETRRKIRDYCVKNRIKEGE